MCYMVSPRLLAKELATLDVVPGGRLLFCFGAGYLEPEPLRYVDELGALFFGLTSALSLRSASVFRPEWKRLDFRQARHRDLLKRL